MIHCIIVFSKENFFEQKHPHLFLAIVFKDSIYCLVLTIVQILYKKVSNNDIRNIRRKKEKLDK